MNFMRRLLVTGLAPVALTIMWAGSALAADAKVAGEWDFSVETQAGTGTPHMSLKQDGSTVTGNYKGQLGEAPVTGTIKGNDLVLSFKISAQGQELVVTYTGVVEGDKSVKGKVALGDLGEGTFTGKKAG
jgi:hypothetical protein